MDHYERFVNANDAAIQKVVPSEKGEHVYRSDHSAVHCVRAAIRETYYRL